MLNIVFKSTPEVIAITLKKLLNNLISENQTAYLNNKFISEGGRLIFDVVEITDSYQIEGILLKVEIEKTFNSVNHLFLVTSLKSMGLKTIL